MTNKIVKIEEKLEEAEEDIIDLKLAMKQDHTVISLDMILSSGAVKLEDEFLQELMITTQQNITNEKTFQKLLNAS